MPTIRPTIRLLSLPLAFAAGFLAAPHGRPGGGLAALAAQDLGRSRRSPQPAGPDPRVTPVVRAVHKAAPSVVNIQVGRRLRSPRGPLLRKIAEASGVIVDESGLCITNWHVVQFHEEPWFALRVILRDGRTFPAKVLSTSRRNDLALLVIEGGKTRFRPIEMGDSDDLMIGETVIAIGNPKGQANTVTAGVLSAVNRRAAVLPPGESRPIEFDDLLQTDAAINPGNSGGALLDIRGRLIGINTLVQKQAEGINFAIPVNRVKAVFVNELLSFDNFGSFWTGLRIRQRRQGLVVERVVAGGPADLAGVAAGDRVVGVAGRPVRDLKALTKRLITASPGQELPLTIERAGRRKEVRLRLWSKVEARIFWLAGFTAAEIAPSARPRLYRRVASELFPDGDPLPFRLLELRSVQPDGPAAELGLKPGEIVLGFKSTDFFGRVYLELLPRGLTDLLAQLEMHRGRSVRILVYRPREGILGGDLFVR